MVLNIWNKKHRDERGFTMVEMMVTIAIISILAAVSIPVFLNQRKVAVDGMVEADIRNAALLSEAWKNQNPDTRFPQFALKNTGSGTVAHTNATVIKGPLSEIKLSNGTTMFFWPGERTSADDTTAPAGSFTILGRNAEGKTSFGTVGYTGDKGIQYSSITGKLTCVNLGGSEIPCE